MHLGIYEAPLAAVARLMLVLLGILTLVTTAAVALGTYLLARRLMGPIRVLRNSLSELGAGRYDYRIDDPRNDELGELYRDFDRAAAALAGPARAGATGRTRAPRRHDRRMADARTARVARGAARGGGAARQVAPRRRRGWQRRYRAAAPVAGAEIARDDDFLVVRVAPGETAATLAQRHLGDRGKAFWIAGGQRRRRTGRGRHRRDPAPTAESHRRRHRRLPGDSDPLLPPVRRQGRAADGDPGRVRGADGLPRAQRLHRGSRSRAWPRFLPGASRCRRRRSSSPSTTATARPTRSPTRSSPATAFRPRCSSTATSSAPRTRSPGRR